MKPRHRQLVNQHFGMAGLLKQMGVSISGGRDESCRCPFHDDTKKSAKYYVADNSLFCWTEQKTFRPADVFDSLGVPEDVVLQQLHARGVLYEDPVEKVKEVKPLFVEGSDEVVAELRAEFVIGKLPLREYIKTLSGYIREK